jgi:phosphoglycerol geranylgeranyltransferase
VEHRVENYILDELRKYGTLCFPLIDSENPTNAALVGNKIESLGASAILIGGSSAIDQIELAEMVSTIKSRISIPVILFPGNVTGVVPKADAILFSSLLNSENPYFITGAQALGALSVEKYNIESLPTGYLVIGEHTTAWFVGHARSIPFDKRGIAVMYALAAQYLGMRFLYLEAGSGAAQNIPTDMVAAVRKHYTGVLIVGGGVRTPEKAKEIAKAGADIIVVGTMIETDDDWENKLSSIIHSIRR